MDLINGFDRASLGFDLDPPIRSGQARGSLHYVAGEGPVWWMGVRVMGIFVTKYIVMLNFGGLMGFL